MMSLSGPIHHLLPQTCRETANIIRFSDWTTLPATVSHRAGARPTAKKMPDFVTTS
ncbi:hypothetical protein Bpfe_014498, partial [Biomphalaria pfeifferi]